MKRNLIRLCQMLLLALLASACAPKKGGASLQSAVEAFERDTRLDLQVYGQPGTDARRIKDVAEVGPADPETVEAFLPTMEAVLMQYPAPIRRELLEDIWVFGRFKIFGKPFLGSADPKQRRFNIALRPTTSHASVTSTMHHEIGHLFEAHKTFDMRTWRQISGDAYTKKNPNLKWGPGNAYLQAGFVSKYASKNPHEDFAEMAELLFTRPDRARQLYDQYPLIRQKMTLLTEHYHRLAPTMVLPWYGDGWRAWKQARERAKARRPRKPGVPQS